jgi:hypothetical protein
VLRRDDVYSGAIDQVVDIRECDATRVGQAGAAGLFWDAPVRARLDLGDADRGRPTANVAGVGRRDRPDPGDRRFRLVVDEARPSCAARFTGSSPGARAGGKRVGAQHARPFRGRHHALVAVRTPECRVRGGRLSRRVDDTAPRGARVARSECHPGARRCDRHPRTIATSPVRVHGRLDSESDVGAVAGRVAGRSRRAGGAEVRPRGACPDPLAPPVCAPALGRHAAVSRRAHGGVCAVRVPRRPSAPLVAHGAHARWRRASDRGSP